MVAAVLHSPPEVPVVDGRRIPGNKGIWVGICCEFVEFLLLFAVYFVARALVPSVLVEAEIAAQRLCQIFPLSLVSPYAYWLLLPRRAELPAALRAFRDWVLATGLQS